MRVAKLKGGCGASQLTWADDDVKSWHSKSTQTAESTAMASSSPSQTRLYAEKIQIPGSRSSLTPPQRPQRGFPSPRSAQLLNGFLFGFQINPSLQPKGLNSIWRTVLRAGWGGWGAMREVAEEKPFRTPGQWAELKTLKDMRGFLLWPIRNGPKTQTRLSAR